MSSAPEPIAFPNDTLAGALARHELPLADEVVERLDRYARTLWQVNEQINLTRHTTYEKFVARDVVDSLALVPFLEPGEKVLDVGTGGGVPGIILAIVRPDLAVALCDSVAKKARVTGSIVETLGLPIKVHHAPAQELLKQQRFDTLVVRAVASISKLLTWLNPVRDQFGKILLIKGPAWVEERGEARHHNLLRFWDLRKLTSYPLAGTDSESVLLALKGKSYL